jgi:hypothetical protein
MRRRTLIGPIAALLLAALAAGPVAAGGWAEAKADGIGSGGDSGDGGGLTEGAEQEIGFRLLQHGVTPVDFGRVMVVATNSETGEAVRAPAAHVGGGRWEATISFPEAGSWQLSVEHSDLLVSNLPIVEVAAAPVARAGAPVGMIGLVGAIALLGAMLLIVSGRRLRGLRGTRPADAEANAKLARA